MKNITVIVIIAVSISNAVGLSLTDQLKRAQNLYEKAPDSAYLISKNVLRESLQISNYHSVVKSNLLLGNIEYIKNKEYGKAIIYYLEATRYSDKGIQQDISQDLVDIYKNCGIIFRKFKSYDLAREYYFKGLEIAKSHNLVDEVVSLNYNLASVYGDLEEYEKSTEILSYLSEICSKDSKYYFYILNRLGFHHFKWGNYDNSIKIYNRALNEIREDNILMRGYLHQNLAKAYREKRKFEKALDNYFQAIALKSKHGNGSSSFSSLYGSGEVFLEQEQFEKAEKQFEMAEELLPNFSLNPDYFDLHKVQANLFFKLKDYDKSKYYQDLYDKKMSEYLEVQKEIQKTDQRYNMDLITKRYFAEVEKQEQIASIMMYSKIISGGLLFLLISVIVYFRYDKVKLRKSIERELVSLRIID